MLRQDPDVILVGEIRDLETAQTAIHGAQTGHLLLSTLHTDTSTQAIDRILSMGCEFSDVAGNVTLIIAQRLVSRLCQRCKVTVPTPPEVAVIFKANGHQVPDTICTPKGCVQCGGFGKVGRLPVMEVFAMTQELRELITEGFKEFELRSKWRKGGGQTLGDYALNLVAQGDVDIRDTTALLLD
jgi:type II secretory ATPase GspE/PulE/Tfp pilus assembly ATPase PilB-like protein